MLQYIKMEKNTPEFLQVEEMQSLMVGLLHDYSFKNNHIMRGPLCRVAGLINLLNHENLDDETRNLLRLLLEEVEEIDRITKSIARMLNECERQITKSE